MSAQLKYRAQPVIYSVKTDLAKCMSGAECTVYSPAASVLQIRLRVLLYSPSAPDVGDSALLHLFYVLIMLPFRPPIESGPYCISHLD